MRGPLDVLQEVWSGEEIEKTCSSPNLDAQMHEQLEEVRLGDCAFGLPIPDPRSDY